MGRLRGNTKGRRAFYRGSQRPRVLSQWVWFQKRYILLGPLREEAVSVSYPQILFKLPTNPDHEMIRESDPAQPGMRNGMTFISQPTRWNPRSLLSNRPGPFQAQARPHFFAPRLAAWGPAGLVAAVGVTDRGEGGPLAAHDVLSEWAAILGVDSLSILFNHRSFQKPDPFSLGFRRFSRRKDPWKEWNWKVPLE